MYCSLSILLSLHSTIKRMFILLHFTWKIGIHLERNCHCSSHFLRATHIKYGNLYEGFSIVRILWIGQAKTDSITKALNPLKLPSLLPTTQPLYALYARVKRAIFQFRTEVCTMYQCTGRICPSICIWAIFFVHKFDLELEPEL